MFSSKSRIWSEYFEDSSKKIFFVETSMMPIFILTAQFYQFCQIVHSKYGPLTRNRICLTPLKCPVKVNPQKGEIKKNIEKLGRKKEIVKTIEGCQILNKVAKK